MVDVEVPMPHESVSQLKPSTRDSAKDPAVFTCKEINNFAPMKFKTADRVSAMTTESWYNHAIPAFSRVLRGSMPVRRSAGLSRNSRNVSDRVNNGSTFCSILRVENKLANFHFEIEEGESTELHLSYC